MVVDANPISRFVHEHCVLEPEAWTPTGVLHEAYQAFCRAQALEAVAAPHFAKALTVCFNLEGLRRKVQGVVTRGIRGIRMH